MSKYTIDFNEEADEILLLDEEHDDVGYEEAKVIISKLKRDYDDNRPTYIYLMYSEKMNLHKIGITSNPVDNRKNNLRRQYNDLTINIINTRICENRREADLKEKQLHKVFQHKLVQTFNDKGAERNLGKEWFRLSTTDLRFICSQKLFIPFLDSFMFHPMAFAYYASQEENCSPQIYQMIAHFSELLSADDTCQR
mgnify:CR=1 FL=1